MFFTLPLLLQSLDRAWREMIDFTFTSTLQHAREHDWTSLAPLNITLGLVVFCSELFGSEHFMRRTRWISRASLALPLLPTVLESNVLPIVKRCLDALLPRFFERTTSIIFLEGPSFLLYCYFPASTVLRMIGSSALWTIILLALLSLLVAETVVYLSPLVLLAATWALVYRDLLVYLRKLTSPKFRAVQRARTLQLLCNTSSDIEAQYIKQQSRLDSLTSRKGQETLIGLVPFEAYELFTTPQSRDLAVAAAYCSHIAENALAHGHGQFLAIAPVFEGLSRFLGAACQAANRNPFDDPVFHFYSTTRSLSLLITQQSLPHSESRLGAFRIFLPFLLTYPGCVLLDYYQWRRAFTLRDRRDLDFEALGPSKDSLNKAAAAAVLLIEQDKMETEPAGKLLPTHIACMISRVHTIVAEKAAREAILDAVLGWKARKNELEKKRFKQD